VLASTDAYRWNVINSTGRVRQCRCVRRWACSFPCHSGVIRTSPDGLTWTVAQPPTNERANGIFLCQTVALSPRQQRHHRHVARRHHVDRAYERHFECLYGHRVWRRQAHVGASSSNADVLRMASLGRRSTSHRAARGPSCLAVASLSAGAWRALRDIARWRHVDPCAVAYGAQSGR